VVPQNFQTRGVDAGAGTAMAADSGLRESIN
jgi:hypothetical protein